MDLFCPYSALYLVSLKEADVDLLQMSFPERPAFGYLRSRLAFPLHFDSRPLPQLSQAFLHFPVWQGCADSSRLKFHRTF